MATATTFTATGAAQDYVVPTGVHNLQVECWGAAGGASVGGAAGGKGGYAKGILAVTPGETLKVYVGRAASSFNGGGSGGSGTGNGVAGGGGGASDVRQGGTALANRKIVAGGGGGGGGAFNAGGGTGGAAGGLTGTSGVAGGSYNNSYGYGGGGASQTSGGTAGSGDTGNGQAGTLGTGGAGGTGTRAGGGGGGGGYYGGGGGGASNGGGGGGGGGASYTGGVTTATTTAGVQAGDGKVVLTPYNTPPNAPSWVTPQDSTIPADQDAYIEIAFSDPDPGDSMSASNWKRWTLDSSGSRVAGSEVDTYQGTPSTKLLLPAGTLTSGTKYEFQADTLDGQGAEGPYSVSLFVTAQNTPAQPTWTDPISGQTIGTSSYTGVISDPTVDSSEWTLYADDGAGNISTTILQGPVTVSTGDVRSHTFTGLANNVPIWWSARVKYQGLWSQPNQIRTPVSYSPPPAPQVTLTPDAANGVLTVGITNPAPGAGEPATSYNNVYVDDGKGAGKERVATNLPTNQPWTYPWPVSLRDYTGNLWVEAVATNGTTAETTA
ncbi:MAG TPA: glycine-rich protein [Acidimicrobiales bacterium]|nr:glycine-rich protein [Acidimicrobiales bacterium]